MAKPVFIALGFISLLLGFIGAFLPILPTTPFAILAAYLFSKGSSRMHAWVRGLPLVGFAICDWEDSGVIRPRAKILSVTMIVLLIGGTIIFVKVPHWIIKVIVGAIGVSVITFIVTRPSGVKRESTQNIKAGGSI